MVVAVVALVMSMTGGAVAAVNFARNAGAVDGKSAVKASSSNKKASGKLVAMNSRGKLPFKFLDGAASATALKNVSAAATRGRNGAQLIAVIDNSQTAAIDLVDLELGKLQVSCVDEQDKAGTENAATRLSVTNAVGGPLNISRRVGTAAPVLTTFAANQVDTFDVGTQNTFSIQLQEGTRSVLVEGTARQLGQGTADSQCAVFATALFVGFQ
jgi:hypothetical protein